MGSSWGAATRRAARRWGWGALTAGCSLLAACSHSPPPPRVCAEPPPLRVTLEGAERLNTDDRGRSLPTVVHLFQLRSPRRLEGADFTAVWQRPKEVFEGDLLRLDELTLEPGETKEVTFPREAQVGYLMALGVFRRPTGEAWRAVHALEVVPPERCGPGAQPAAAADARFHFSDTRVDAAPAAPAAGAATKRDK